MFSQFFNLKENPFKLTYDPAYLFTSRHHEEALAHLRYAVAEGEGFTIITGGRGVGKSTICRAFLHTIDEHASKAFLAGPLANPKELMHRINSQFGIRAEAESIKELIDALNEFLMQQRLAGKKVVTFIDDAQLLSPEVLEQIRLLSNLETTRDKLIQIVLIGEPELLTLLDSHELRQMGQRVSVCYEIGPLTPDETAVYLQHRLSLAAHGPPVRFAPLAVRHIFRYSGGNPRLINIAGHAALSVAFRARQKEITVEIAQIAIQDLNRRNGREVDTGTRRKPLIWALAISGMLLVSAGTIYMLRQAEDQSLSPTIADTPLPSPTAIQSDYGTAVSPSEVVAPPEPVHDPAVNGAGTADEMPPIHAGTEHSTMTHSVQVGAYLNPENAQKMVVQLTAKGYPTRISKVTDSKGRNWYMVLIGDHPTRQAAQAQADEFRRREKMQSLVRPYEAN